MSESTEGRAEAESSEPEQASQEGGRSACPCLLALLALLVLGAGGWFLYARAQANRIDLTIDVGPYGTQEIGFDDRAGPIILLDRSVEALSFSEGRIGWRSLGARHEASISAGNEGNIVFEVLGGNRYILRPEDALLLSPRGTVLLQGDEVERPSLVLVNAPAYFGLTLVNSAPKNSIGVDERGQPPGSVVKIVAVAKDSPAARAGVRPGDILLEAAGRAAESHLEILSRGDFAEWTLGLVALGNPVELTLQRGEERLTIAVTPRQRQLSEYRAADAASDAPELMERY